ncbi:MAG TPA: ribonuclease R [Anaerohalosphaeraceae bacterium]|nr:ribonuclease R [Anaerohalosphaeraceae bacterium]HPB93273.1 ribonuclease R [Anaerohalosphaeraceae bacterium]HRT23713.1 ribonuclease R [Anaerohalosphaeraceae bacterium]HRU15370.1 ribonuclease R [Anaerohalosphaeraceae bacterium]
MENYKLQILNTLTRRDYEPMTASQLAGYLGVGRQDTAAFRAALDQLRKSGQIVTDARKHITLPPMADRVIGTFRANPRGFGFLMPLTPNAHGDLYIAAEDINGAMSGDIVQAQVVRRGKRDGQWRYGGRIIQIIERGSDRFVGTLQRRQNTWFIQPEGKGFFGSILIDDAPSSGAKENDKVVVEITRYPQNDQPARGAIVRVLGKAGQYETEIRSIMERFALPEDFDEACRRQAHQAVEQFDPDKAADRADLSDEIIITIDPADAKDFDDAISLRKDRDGNWRLGVHIADVSAFIPMHSPLDEEARRRGNSVYLPGKVIPMLPEVLSNGICSLQPGQKRFTKSVYITYNAEGKVLQTEFDNTIIRSTARLTYEEADRILRGRAKGFPGEVVALLKDMETLAKAIEARRRKAGMIHLDLPETELIYDASGQVIDARPADDSYPHTIIEMFMVEANEAVAGLLDRFRVPFLRRIHPAPDAQSAKNLGRFIKLFRMKVPRVLDRQAIQDLLESVKGTPLSYAINTYVLRSLPKAEYSPLNIGHYALASTHYCHFTSPIRRYADLLVHRLLDCYIRGTLNKIGLEEVLPELELREIGRHLTWTEEQAENAENELKTILILQMLTKHIGEEMEAVVSGLTNFGIFVQCLKFGIEGLIEPGDLGLDEWKYDPRAQAVIGKWSGQSIRLGQPLKVRIVSVNLPARQLFVAPAEPLISRRGSSRRAKNAGKKR